MAEENFDRATCLLACRDKWLESRQLGSTLALVSQPWVVVKLYFFQSGQESKVIIRLFVIFREGTLGAEALSGAP